MIYIHHNKRTNKLKAFGSLVAISKHESIKFDKLVYYFTRKKRSVYEDLDRLIEKSELIRSKHK